jgi:hypothetical protein
VPPILVTNKRKLGLGRTRVLAVQPTPITRKMRMILGRSMVIDGAANIWKRVIGNEI